MTAHLFPNEELLEISGIPLLVYHRSADPGRPLLVFFTGGGHLARVVYGHPGSNPGDFLDHWFADSGFGMLAVSYPSDHPLFDRPEPDLGLSQWAGIVADLAVKAVGETRSLDRLVAFGWSMGGKMAFAFNRALKARGQGLHCFISLSATPPFPSYLSKDAGPEFATPDGLWDLSPGRGGGYRQRSWLAELAATDRAHGRTVISADDYRRHYRANTPIALRGPQLKHNHPRGALGHLRTGFDDAASFARADYPICAAIAPTDASDLHHALNDRLAWAAITAQGLASQIEATGFRGQDLAEIVALFEELPARLSRRVPGGHMFFIGKSGASATASHLGDLLGEVDRLKIDLSALTTSAEPSDT